MAKTQKIENIALDRFRRKASKRKPKEIKVFFLIVSEGTKTEPNYFKKFSGKHGSIIFEIDCEGKGYNTLKVVEEAIKEKEKNPTKYSRIWAVFDKDSFPNEHFNKAIQLAKDNDIGCAWSNEAFELWYLLHFQPKIIPKSRFRFKAAIEQEIQKYQAKFRYRKNSEDMYEIINRYGNQEEAIKNAQKLAEKYKDDDYANHNPRTQVYELVKQLTGKDEELNYEIKTLFK